MQTDLVLGGVPTGMARADRGGAREGSVVPAFTLIELLVVIAIISVLISLLLPALGAARDAGRGAACLGNMRSIGQAVAMYTSANRERLPISSHTAGSIVNPSAWLTALEDFGAVPAVRKCPSDPARNDRATSYATNEHFEPLAPGIDINPVTRKPIPGGRTRAFDRLSLIPKPFAVIYAYEPAGTGTIDHLNTHQFKTAADVGAAIAVTRHRGASNLVYVDGHAKPWAWSEIQRTFSPQTSPFDPETAR